MKIKFIGAAKEVTGSKHLITTDHGKKILLDCGMFQGKGLETDAANRNTMVDPKDVDYIILTPFNSKSASVNSFSKNDYRSVRCVQ